MSPESSLDLLLETGSDARSRQWLVGVSGGVDSTALLWMLKSEGFSNLIVCHVNHGLRGADSDADQEFVRLLSADMGYVFETQDFAIADRMEESGNSMETEARSARHEFFAEMAKKYDCCDIVLAHHADDQAETVLWNLMRGSLGCRGMQAIRHLQVNGETIQIFRPFLEIRKSKLIAWMREKGKTWREEASNSENFVIRNRLRNQVLPLIAEVAGRDVIPMFVKTAATDDSWRELLDWAKTQVQVIDPQGRIHVGAMRALPPILQKALFSDYLKENGCGGVSTNILAQCVKLTEVKNSHKITLPGGKILRRRQGRIFLEIV